MAKYYIKISGSIWNMDGMDKKDIEKQLQNMPIDVFCSFHVMEIGVDCDELGYTIRRDSDGNVTT